MTGGRPQFRATSGSDPIRAGRKALDIAQLCTLRPLPQAVVEEFDKPLIELLQDAEGAIRAKVALRLAACSWAPRDAVRMLAFEPLEISEPILARSPVIPDADLITLADEDRRRRLLIARRPRVSEAVSAAVARHRELDCLMALARNETAALSDRSAGDFAAVARTETSLQEALAARADMGMGLARAIYVLAGDVVKATLTDAYPDLARHRLEEAVDDALFAPDEGDEAAEALTGRLQQQGTLTKTDVLRAARNGRSDIADHAVARLTGLPATDWRRALSRSPLRVSLLAGRAMAMTSEEAGGFYVALVSSGRAHAIEPDGLARACADIYSGFSRDDARKALHRLGADGSIG